MSDLRAIAEAAKADKLPWPGARELEYEWCKEDAAHIAAWSPDRVLAALDVIEALRVIAAQHSPDPDGGMGWVSGHYGQIDPACLVCGTSDEYAVPWPCRTRATADAALDRWEVLG